MILKTVYTIFLGLFLALFIGIGIHTFYPEPTNKTPACMIPPSPIEKRSTSFQEKNCQKEQEVQQEAYIFYAEVVSTVSLIAAVIYLFISFTLFRTEQTFSYGFLFGSMCTLLYSVLKGLTSNHTLFTFSIVTISLGLVITIGYFRFVTPEISHKKYRLDK